MAEKFTRQTDSGTVQVENQRQWYGPELNRKGLNLRRTDENLSIDDVRQGKMKLRGSKEGQEADDKDKVADKLREWSEIRLAYVSGGVEGIKEHPLLKNYHDDYERLSANDKTKISWEEIVSRLLDSGAHYLNLALGLQEGGILWGVDAEGNPLFADKGVEPVMKGMSYNKTFEELYGKEYPDNKKEAKAYMKAHTGYEMFNSKKEVRAVEKFTGELFVASEGRDEYRSSHLFSGKDPSWTREAFFGPGDRCVDLDSRYGPHEEDIDHGVRRKLVVKKLPEVK